MPAAPGPLGSARVALLLITLAVSLIWLVSPSSAQSDTIYVKAGQPIQAAIHAAHPGDRVVVGAGVYAEQLTIQTDGIVLVGDGAVLVPPATPSQNLCSGLSGNDTEAGICVAGSDVELAPFVFEHRKVLSVGQPVKGVSITGFQVRGFSGQNIAVVGAQDAQVTENWLYDGVVYGFLTAGSTNSRVVGNAVVSSGELRYIAICNDDKGGTQIEYNAISGYDIGLCIETNGAELQHNDISDCCIGAYIDPGVDGVKLQHNRFSKTNPRCVKDFGFAYAGIIVDGSVNSEIQFNLIEGQIAGGLATGVAIVDDFTTDPPSVASGNMVTRNTLRNNDLDIYLNTTGTGNVVAKNLCSTPAELCG